MTPTEILTMAQQLLGRADAQTAGLWPRAAALLARQALEQGLDTYWRDCGLALHECSTRPQLLCLGEYLGDEVLASSAHHTWSALSEACHHHPYELAPDYGELRAWIATTAEVLVRLERRDAS